MFKNNFHDNYPTIFAQESDCIVVHKFVKKQITLYPPPKKNNWGGYPLGTPWSIYGSYYEFMTDLSEGKNVRSLYLHEDMIEQMKIYSEAVRILYGVFENRMTHFVSTNRFECGNFSFPSSKGLITTSSGTSTPT